MVLTHKFCWFSHLLRTHFIGRIFEIEHVLFVRTKDNPSDLGTKFGAFSDVTDRLNRDSLFRNGPSFLSKGVSEALKAKKIISLKSVPFIPSLEKVAR